MKCIEDEIPFELPEGWEWCNLAMIGQTNIGLTYKPTDKSNTGVMVLRSSNIVNSHIDLSDLVRVDCRIRENQYVLKHDILICARNGSKALVGKCAIIPELNEPASFGAFMAIYRTAFYEYIYYFLNSEIFRRVFDDGNSTTINQLTQSMLKGALVPLPPVSEQKRIIFKIQELYQHIDVIENEGIQLENAVYHLKNKILDMAIRGQLVPQNEKDEPTSILLEYIRSEKEQLIKEGKIKKDRKESVIFRGDDNSYYEKIGTEVVDITDKIPFEIPENWIWCRGSQCFTGMQNKKPCGDYFDYIDIDAIDNRSHRIKEPKRLSVAKAPSRASRAVQTGSVLFSLVRPYLKNIAYVSDKYSDCIASTGFYVCNSSGLLEPKYMYYLMISNYVVDGLNQFMKGDNSPSINASDIEGWLYPIPPKNEQTRIVQSLENLLKTVEFMEQHLS